jgi:hypothetical protein
VNLVLRFVRRELRSTEARILVLALAVAVASVGAVAMFADRVKGAFANQANVLLGADAMISGDRPLPETFAQTAAAMGLKVTESSRFGSMISARPRTQLQQRQDNQCSLMSRQSPHRTRCAAHWRRATRGVNGCRWSRRSSRAKCLLMNGWRRGWASRRAMCSKWARTRHALRRCSPRSRRLPATFSRRRRRC